MMTHNDNHASERRFGQRCRAFKKAQLVSDGHGGVYDAILRNLSRTGALLDMPGSEFMPKTFTMRLLADNVSRKCQIVWRKQGLMGVVFTP